MAMRKVNKIVKNNSFGHPLSQDGMAVTSYKGKELNVFKLQIIIRLQVYRITAGK